MTLRRRDILKAGGGLAAALTLPPDLRATAGTIDIKMQGRADGSRVWFDPVGLLIQQGETIRWINEDGTSAHTATAYHPNNTGHALRIPQAARPWDSGYVMPGETFSHTFTVPGVYDYYCYPHERAGMAGRIIVETPGDMEWLTGNAARAGVPEAALRTLPPVSEIMQKGRVRPDLP